MKTLSAEQRQFLETSVSRYQTALAADTSAQEYLKGRGIGPAVAAQFRLGVVTSPLAGHEGYQGRLAIPYLTPSGPVSFNFRCTRPHDCKEAGCKKYLKPAGEEGHLYNVAALKADSDFAVVTEGEIDAISWTMAGVPAVSLAGVKAWKTYYKFCLDDFPVIYVAADADKAGDTLVAFLAKEINARPIHYPEGMDANDIWRTGGAGALRALIPG
ncbi:toprim domain-containing protein [Streptomyces sp. URMC 129]|uniref:toprim domain-containing protein n=1 Tax=Streptomyces sp. URMC 129 TaxID=3423407 RepID=UPI003F195CFA